MIPKVIHYCWFGRGEKSKLIKKCINSWHKYCPDYEIIEWNEDNFDINSNIFVRQAYECKKWAFVSDYARLWVLFNYGGIYLDTDVEVIKNLDSFFKYNAFLGFECETRVGTGIMAADKGNKFIYDCLHYYDGKCFIQNGQNIDEPNVLYVTDILQSYGLNINNTTQTVNNITIFSKEYFCPNPYERVRNILNNNTYTIHYLDSSWRTQKGRSDLKRALIHSTRRYRAYETLKIAPQLMIRKIIGDSTVEKFKRKLRGE